MPKESAYVCPRCGSPVVGGAPQQECPHCKTITKAGSPSAKDAVPDTLLAPSAPAPSPESTASLVGTGQPREPAAAPRASIPGYEILGELGRGGMGVVYKARHVGLNRVVALKMILSAEHAGKEAVARFKAEAEAVAQLRHPNIIQVYDIGEQDGRPFFSMEYVEGGSLQNRIGGQPQPPKWCAEIAEKLALAMHVAHSQGIVHRDLKPANVLLTTQGDPKIMDFGLAKRVESGEALTQSGAVMGTPQYMAPEQASGEARRVGPPADVYALGAILYTMLTGKPPFSADTAMGVLRKVLNDEPTPPTTMHRRIPPDLETICLKCLQKEPQKRYASAQELAADLRRFLNHEPIVARPSGPWERAAKWARRRPAVAALIGVSVIALLSIVGGSLWYSAQLGVERDRAQCETLEKERQRQKAVEQEEAARKSQRDAEKRLADSLVSQADALCLARRFVEGISRYDEARLLFGRLGEPVLPAEAGMLDAYEQASVPLGTFRGHADSVLSVVFSPDGKFALSGSGDKTLKLWDVATGRELRTFSGHRGTIWSVAFSPNGKIALSGSEDNTVKLWDVATGRELRTFSGHAKRVKSVAFCPDGRFALSGSFDNTLKLWDVTTGRDLRTFSHHSEPVLCVAFSPDGKLALSGSCDSTMKLWDLAMGRELRTLSGHVSGITGLAFSSNGKFALSGSGDNTVRLWDVATGQELRTFSGHALGVEDVAFSPDGKLALSAGGDRSLRLWDVAAGTELRTFRGHTSPVDSVAFSPDGKYALSGSGDKTLRLWGLVRGRELRTFRGHAQPVSSVALSPDGRIALSASYDKTAKEWDVATGRELRTLSGHAGNVCSAAFSPDGKCALSGSDDKTLRLWDVTTGRELRRFSGHAAPVQSVAFSPDGEFVLSGSGDKTLKLWDAATGRELRTFTGHAKKVMSVAFSQDGKLALSGSGDPEERTDDKLRLWEVATGKELRAFSGHVRPVCSVAFFPDGEFALSGSWDTTVRLWDVATGRQLRVFMGHASWVYGVAVSPDAKFALSGSNDMTVKLWDVAVGRELHTFSSHADMVSSVAFSPDGQSVLSGSHDKTLQLRDFSRPARYREFDAKLPRAREAIQKNENDADGWKTFGEWYAFRGVNDWAVEMLEKARKNGADLSPLTLARCYWLLSEDEHEPADKRPAHRTAAAAEFQKEIARVKAQPVAQDAKAKLAREQEELYLSLCLQAVQKLPPEPAKPTETK